MSAALFTETWIRRNGTQPCSAADKIKAAPEDILGHRFLRTVPREAGRQVRRYVANAWVVGNLLDAARCLSPVHSGDAPISRRTITASM
jgi:hypothetical protein